MGWLIEMLEQPQRDSVHGGGIFTRIAQGDVLVRVPAFHGWSHKVRPAQQLLAHLLCMHGNGLQAVGGVGKRSGRRRVLQIDGLERGEHVNLCSR